MSFKGKPQSEINALERRVVGDLRIADFPPFLRVLLTTDGTVTNSLEAFFWEPVAVELIQQQEQTLAEDAPVVGLLKGQNTVVRHVQLKGVNSGRVYVKADSLIRLDLLPDSFRHDLTEQKLGIGELLRDCGLETYREILEIGYDAEYQGVYRTYRIVMEHRPFIQITEHFPLAVFQ